MIIPNKMKFKVVLYYKVKSTELEIEAAVNANDAEIESLARDEWDNHDWGEWDEVDFLSSDIKE